MQLIVDCLIFSISLAEQEVILIERKVKKKIYEQNQEWMSADVQKKSSTLRH